MSNKMEVLNMDPVARAYDESNHRDNERNAGKLFNYCILDHNFCETSDKGVCTNFIQHYDAIEDCNIYTFIDVTTHKVRSVSQFCVKISPVLN